MTILRGHEDLRPKAIVGFDMGFALVQCGNEIKRYRMAIGPNGSLVAQPVEEESTLPDQLVPESEPELRARRMHTIDQM